MRKDFNYLCHVNVEEWHKYKFMCLFPVEKLASEGLKAFGDKNGCTDITVVVEMSQEFRRCLEDIIWKEI